MEWITTKHIQSTDGKTEKIHCELRLNFPTSQWNKNEKSPVIQLFYYDYKIEGGWWIDNAKTKWYTYPPHKHCEIRFNYFQRMPESISVLNRETGYWYKEQLKHFNDVVYPNYIENGTVENTKQFFNVC